MPGSRTHMSCACACWPTSRATGRCWRPWGRSRAAGGAGGPFTAADGTRRARGVAMASPFGSEVATIAEVSMRDGAEGGPEVWGGSDPGRSVNPAIIEAQVNSAVALGLSSALLEEVVYEGGVPGAR